MITRRAAFYLSLFLICIIFLYQPWMFPPSIQSRSSRPTYKAPSQATDYFEQVFSVSKPAKYDFKALRKECEHTEWLPNEVYLECGGIVAGLTTIISQVKVCLKMAIESGHGIILPSIPHRDSKSLSDFNLLNEDAYMSYNEWFEEDHLLEQMKRVCPQIRIIKHSNIESGEVVVQNSWPIHLSAAPGYEQFRGYFWKGRNFKTFFDLEYQKLMDLYLLNPENKDDPTLGITAIQIHSQFLAFRITDDPTGQDLQLWNDLGHLIRFKEAPRQLVGKLLHQINRPFYGVHFRVESDAIWSSLESQLKLDLDALDKAWTMYGDINGEKPLIYLACGDQEQVEKFVLAGAERGWEVTHKWKLAQSDTSTLEMINRLAFDQNGAVDMGIMLKSHFFLGITGSAFSSSIANARDATGRYRGSSFTVSDDGNARTHLFNDGDSIAYPCCL